jgi:NADH-quinone oxidoreductase subunit M
MSSIGLPGLNGFVGEFLIMLGAWLANPTVAAASAFGVVLAAAYMLWMFRRVMFGPVDNPENRGLIDLDLREKVVLVAMIAPIVWIGVQPGFFLSRLTGSTAEIVSRVEAARSAGSAVGATATIAVGETGGAGPIAAVLAARAGAVR